MTLEELAEEYATHDYKRGKALLSGDIITARRKHRKALESLTEAFKAGYSFDEIWYAIDDAKIPKGGALM